MIRPRRATIAVLASLLVQAILVASLGPRGPIWTRDVIDLGRYTIPPTYTDSEQRIAALLTLVAALSLAGAITYVAARFPTDVGRWHPGKLVIVWLAGLSIGLLAYSFGASWQRDSGIRLQAYVDAFLLGIIGGAGGLALVLTWRWLSAREQATTPRRMPSDHAE
jgi:hypothetical protein